MAYLKDVLSSIRSRMSAFFECAELGKAPLAPQPQVQQILGRVHITVQDDHVAGPVQGIKNVLVRAQLEPVAGLAFTAVTPLAASPPRGRCTRLHLGLGLLLLLLPLGPAAAALGARRRSVAVRAPRTRSQVG